MRIRGIGIRSFGSLRDRSYAVSDGMTVFHGPNESGKTTTMEFIRTVLVPSSKRNQYPEREKTDSGTLTYEQDGETRTVRLVQKSVEGERPAFPTGTDDPQLFRSVFAMTSRDLDDEKVLTEGGIRTRFLTVPGGESMPAARDAATERWETSLGRRSNSRSRAISLEAEMSDLDREIAQARSVTDQYGELDARRRELISRLNGLESESKRSVEAKRIHDVYESNRGNYERLESLKSQREALGGFVPVTDADRAEFERLKSESVQTQSALQSLTERRGREEADLMGADRRRVSAHSKAIEGLPGRLQVYRDDSKRLRELQDADRRIVVEPQPRPKQGRGSGGLGLVAVGAVLAVLGVIAALAVEPMALALTVVGAVIVALGMRRPATVEQPMQTVRESGESAEAEGVRSRMSSFEDDVMSIMDDLGVDSFGVEDDVSFLLRARDAAVALGKTDNEIMRARMDQGAAGNRLLSFTQRYAGEEGFRVSQDKTARAAAIDSEIAVLRDAITKVGLDPDVPECPVPYEGDTVTGEIGEARQEIGALEERMKAILDTRELERMMDRRAQLESEMHRVLDDGAVGLLASAIADVACDEIYSKVQPGVISTADRYLSMMTDGRYRIDTDPRLKELSVRSGDEVKPIGAWSSGLRAQVLLSVKLAVAKEMGGGEVPVVLDDVLLPFDSERKAGACRALSEMSSEMQILLFTCDRETVDICSSMPGVSLVRMTEA